MITYRIFYWGLEIGLPEINEQGSTAIPLSQKPPNRSPWPPSASWRPGRTGAGPSRCFRTALTTPGDSTRSGTSPA